MRLTGYLFLRVEPALPRAASAAARAQGIGRSEFIRRAVLRAISSTTGPDDHPPPQATPAARLPAVAA